MGEKKNLKQEIIEENLERSHFINSHFNKIKSLEKISESDRDKFIDLMGHLQEKYIKCLNVSKEYIDLGDKYIYLNKTFGDGAGEELTKELQDHYNAMYFLDGEYINMEEKVMFRYSNLELKDNFLKEEYHKN